MTEITENARRFILDSFADVDQLRLFLRLSGERERVFSPGALRAILGLTPDKIETGLTHLKEAGLIEKSLAEPESGFRFNPASPGLAELAEEVARLDPGDAGDADQTCRQSPCGADQSLRRCL